MRRMSGRPVPQVHASIIGTYGDVYGVFLDENGRLAERASWNITALDIIKEAQYQANKTRPNRQSRNGEA